MDVQKNLPRHPDENLLVAFAEDALTQPERDDLLQHLTSCPRCREVVFLAHEASPEHQTEPAVAQPILAQAKLKARQSRRRLLWVLEATGVIAAVAVLLLVFPRWRQRNVQQTAQSKESILTTPAPSPPVSPSTHAILTAPPVSEKLPEISSTRSTSRHQAKAAPASPPELNSLAEARASESAIPQQQLQPRSGVSGIGTRSTGATIGGAMSTVQNRTLPPAAKDLASQRTAALVSPSAKTAPQPQQSYPTQLLRMNNSAITSTISPAPAFQINNGVVVYCLGRACSPRPLPGTTPAASTAFSGRTVMALDTDGHLFVSEDQAVHWDQVASQWMGKAHSLRLADSGFSLGRTMPGPSNNTAAENIHDQLPSPAAAKLAPAAPTFELINDQGQTWLSSDRGLTWTLKILP